MRNTTFDQHKRHLEAPCVSDDVVKTIVAETEFDQADLHELSLIDSRGQMTGHDARFLEDSHVVELATEKVLIGKGLACGHCKRRSLSHADYLNIRGTVKAALLEHLWCCIQRLRGPSSS